MPLGSLKMTFKQFTKENTRQDEEYALSFFWMFITINNNNNDNNNNNNNNNNKDNNIIITIMIAIKWHWIFM